MTTSPPPQPLFNEPRRAGRWFAVLRRRSRDVLPDEYESVPAAGAEKTGFSFFANACRLVACFCGIQAGYVTWPLLRKKIMTTQYGPAPSDVFPSAVFLIFANQLMAMILALVIIRIRRAHRAHDITHVPVLQFATCAISDTISSRFLAQFGSLGSVSFPVQIFFKSSKVLAVMLVGQLLAFDKQRFTRLRQYIEKAVVCCGVAVFTLTARTAATAPNALSLQAGQPSVSTGLGIALLLAYTICDSFTWQWQYRLYHVYDVDQFTMMFSTNAWQVSLSVGLSV